MTSSVDRPNPSTRRFAMILPTPRTRPEPRYFSIPTSVAGFTVT